MKKLALAVFAAMIAVAAAPASAAEGDAPAKPRKKLQMKTYVNQFEKAKADAKKYETPILVVVLLDNDDKSAFVKKYLLGNRTFKQLCQENFATLVLKGQKSATAKAVEPKSFKNWSFIAQHVMPAGRTGMDDKPESLRFYPGAFFVTADGEKKLADMPAYNPELGFGAWALDAMAKFEKAGIEITKSPALEKAMANPVPDVKQQAGKGKKK